MIKLSINILTWNTYRTLKESLAVIALDIKKLDQEGFKSEIIIVDNGSMDGCEHLATIKNKENLGISVGKNQGIKASNGEYILLLDGDIVPVVNSIYMLVKALDENKHIDALGFYPNKFTTERNKYGKENHETFCNKLEPIEEQKGHCVYFGIYRRGIFDKVMFDESFKVGYGYEDLDFYMQMEQLGIKQYVAGINHKCGKYFHAINSSIRVMGNEKYRETEKERGQYFYGKWPGAKSA